MTLPVYADILRPASKGMSRLFDVALVAAFSLLVAGSAQIAIPLPFTPVPVTLQTFMVLATGALLGSGRGAAAILLYLGEGAAGLPVFQSGHAGIPYMIGPTGGYLIGFAAAAFIAGFLSEKGWDRKWHTAIAALFLADVALFVTGVLWLGVYTGFTNALVLGTLPFAAVDAVKVIACASLLPLGWKALETRK
jgi:biotin transport system substrate-specific component